jgi:hypothetical protein
MAEKNLEQIKRGSDLPMTLKDLIAQRARVKGSNPVLFDPQLREDAPSRIWFCDHAYPDNKEPDDLMKLLIKRYISPVTSRSAY